MGDLSEHFSQGEFLDPNNPDSHRDIDPRLIRGLEILRDKVGTPIKIHSGLRILDFGSTHADGRAADISSPTGLRVLHELALRVEVFSASGVGLYPEEKFIHVDVGRDAPLRWVRISGQYWYWT